MKIIAVDPGYDRVGLAILEKSFEPGQPGREEWLYSQTFQTQKDLDINQRLFAVGERVSDLCREYEVEYLALEKLFFNSNQKTAMHVAEARGVIIYAAQQAGAQIQEFTPLQIKVAVTGHGRSDKQAVIGMTKRLIHIPETPHQSTKREKRLDDEYDAIACGLTFFAHFRHTRERA